MSAGRRRAFWQPLDRVLAQAGASGWRSTHSLQSELDTRNNHDFRAVILVVAGIAAKGVT